MDQLKSISKTLQELVDYEGDVSGGDLNDAITYSKIQDLVDEQITELDSRADEDKRVARNS